MDIPAPHDIYSVSRLNQEVRLLLEQAFPLVWVEGEISNLARPRSGHLYFTLKDSDAQVRCALFRNRSRYLRFTPENGARVRIRARIGLYAPRGDYQLIAEHMEPAGDGALQQAFEALKARLDAEGLFDAEHKQPLPALPRRIGIITSPTGAAIRDILSVLARRFPALPVLVYPVRVQGEGAAAEVARAIALADQRADADVLVVSRGGGSLEDLQPFNDEQVARAIAAATVPIVSAVGHEVDVTIADLVADHRAPTPSAAAEQLSPDAEALGRGIAGLDARLARALARRRQQQREQVLGLARRLSAQHPGRQLQERAQRLDGLEQRLTHALQQRLARRAERLTTAQRRLQGATPRQLIERLEAQRGMLAGRLQGAIQNNLTTWRHRLHENARALEAVSPLRTLERGYAIVRHAPNGPILREAKDLREGDRVTTRLGKGAFTATVDGVQATDPEQNRI